VISIEPAPRPGHSSESSARLTFPARSRPRDGPSKDSHASVDRRRALRREASCSRASL